MGGGKWLTLRHFRASAFDNKVVLTLSTALAHILSRRKFSFPSMVHTRLGSAKGFSGLMTLALCARSETVLCG